jgi:hypothetical protein
MQLWVFFEPGVGGDGLCNLLEQSTDCNSLAAIKQWRPHRYVDGDLKFWMPTPDVNHCFRKAAPFKQHKNQFHNNYVNLVNQDQGFVIIPSHGINLRALETSDCQDILTANQKKVLLLSKDRKAAFLRAERCRLLEIRPSALDYLPEYLDYQMKQKINIDKFDSVVYIEDLRSNFEIFDNFCNTLGIVADKNHYDTYLQLIQRELFFVSPGITYHSSRIDENGILKYDQVDSDMVIGQRKKLLFDLM